MDSQHLDRLDGLVTIRVHDRAELERFLCAAASTIADLRVRLDAARWGLAQAEARAVSAGDLVARVGAMVLAAQLQVTAERLEAERDARMIADAAAATAGGILAAALAEASATGELRLRAVPTARVLDFSARAEGTDGRLSARWAGEQIVAI